MKLAADLATLQRKARYGHKSFVYWYAADGSLNWAQYSRAAIKQAILSVGVNGRFYWLDGSGCSHVARSFRMMTTLWRCAPKGGAA